MPSALISRSVSSAICSTEYLMAECVLRPAPRWSWTITRKSRLKASTCWLQNEPWPDRPGTSMSGSPWPASS